MKAVNTGHLDLAAVMCGMQGDQAAALWAAMREGLGNLFP